MCPACVYKYVFLKHEKKRQTYTPHEPLSISIRRHLSPFTANDLLPFYCQGQRCLLLSDLRVYINICIT